MHAEDGDKGNPREIRYGLVSEGNPFTSFFDINDTTGKFSLTFFLSSAFHMFLRHAKFIYLSCLCVALFLIKTAHSIVGCM